MLLLASIFLVFFGEAIYENQIEPLINKEVNVANGDAEIESGLNGRVGRWERYFDIWFSEVPFYSKLIGVPTSGHRLSPVMCGGGMHDDYVRNLFTSGIIGIFFYLTFLGSVVYRALFFKIPERFLIIGSVIAIMLHSISTVPLAYSAYVSLLFSIISYALLPIRHAYRATSWGINRKAKKRGIQVRQISPVPEISGYGA